MRTDDAVPVTAEAADVDLDAAPGDEAAVVDAELPVDVDRLARVRLQKLKKRLGESGVVAGIVATPGALAGAAEEVGGVVVGKWGAAAAAEVVRM